MNNATSVPPDIDGNKPSGAQSKSRGFFGRSKQQHPVNDSTAVNSDTANNNKNNKNNVNLSDVNVKHDAGANANQQIEPSQETGSISTGDGSAKLGLGSSAQDEKPGTVIDGDGATLNSSQSQNKKSIPDGNTADDEDDGGDDDKVGKPKNRTILEETRRTFWMVITHSWVNVLLVFVPVGIAVANVDGIHPGIVFAMNCIAVVPLAGLLAHATESVASKLGDALGALLNVTFGNAVELIIFIIALTKGQIRIVQASLLGSILANLLLILGMGFFLGGLRYREQVYNSTVTQMSACLLSLSVISLVLPTAFHASFSNQELANRESLKISRGTSVILLLVYIIYLVFQLKSHAYMYESTPQHIVDAEAIPGPAAGWLDTSSSDSSSSSSSDSDDSSQSRDTVRKTMRKVLRGGRRRKSSVISFEGNRTRTSSFGTADTSPQDEKYEDGAGASRPRLFPRTSSGETEEAIEDDKASYLERHRRHRRHRKEKKKQRRERRERRHEAKAIAQAAAAADGAEAAGNGDHSEPRRVDFALQQQQSASGGNTDFAEDSETAIPKRPTFPTLRGMSVRNLAPTVFSQRPDPMELTHVPAGPVPRVRYGIRRTNSLPDRLQFQQQQQQQQQFAIRAPGGMFPARVPIAPFSTVTTVNTVDADEEEEHMTKAAAIILLLVSTGLVAACAEFLVGSIEDVVESSSIGEIFIGLIILPIVGNAAEHVTAITVAMKNKMDLAIGVAVGSSIQIALFVTPFIVILGWIINKDMTLYFNLFETVCLFVSAFIVNFLVLDGRSNYLEGALLCAVYIIIAVVAFFYPDQEDTSQWGHT